MRRLYVDGKARIHAPGFKVDQLEVTIVSLDQRTMSAIVKEDHGLTFQASAYWLHMIPDGSTPV